MERRKIIFYDGDCGFCNRSVQFVLDHETSAVIYFAALQSDFSKDFFAKQDLPEPDLSTFYFWDEHRMYSKSDGALRVLKYLKFPWPLLRIGFIVPRFLRNAAYDWIARRRHRLANGFCALPTPEQRKRFLE